MKNSYKKEVAPLQMEQARKRLRESSRRYGKLSLSTVETFLQFLYTFESMAAHLSCQTRQKGLTRAGLNVLAILRSSEGKGCQHNQISRLLLVSRANITGVVNSLIRQGLVERDYDRKDRRVCIARITKKGEAFLDSFLPDYHAVIEGMFSGFNAADKKMFDRLMEKMRVAIHEQKD